MLPISISQWAAVRPQICGNNHTQLTGINRTNSQDKTELLFIWNYECERISV